MGRARHRGGCGAHTLAPDHSAGTASPQRAMSRRYVSVDSVAERYGCAPKTVYRLAERHELPFRKLRGRKALLFDEAELDLFDDGAVLETMKLPNGGVRVRPRGVVTPSLQTKRQTDGRTGNI